MRLPDKGIVRLEMIMGWIGVSITRKPVAVEVASLVVVTGCGDADTSEKPTIARQI